MLTYNPAFDLHHGVFRILQILVAAPGIEFEVVKMRLLDFLLLFPEQLENVRVPPESIQKRNLFTRDENPYRILENPHRLFVELAPLQQGALYALAAHDVIDHAKLKRDFVARTTKPLPPPLEKIIVERNATTPQLIDIISHDLGRIPMFGEDGLKERIRFLSLRHELV